MRKFIKTLVLAVMMGVSFTSCKKSEVEPVEPEVEYPVYVDMVVKMIPTETKSTHPLKGWTGSFTVTLNEGLNDSTSIRKHIGWMRPSYVTSKFDINFRDLPKGFELKSVTITNDIVRVSGTSSEQFEDFAELVIRHNEVKVTHGTLTTYKVLSDGTVVKK